MTASIPPGWYDDPSSPGMERWWDGAQWTESSRPRADSGPGVPPAPGYPADQMPGGLSAPSQTPAYPQYGPYGPGGGPGGPGGPPNRRNRNVLIGVVSLLVVGGIVAALIVLLGGGDDDGGGGSTVAGQLTDPASGLTLPHMKDWVATDKDEPAHQVFGKYPCGDESGSPSDEPSDEPSADASSDPGEQMSGCFLGEIQAGPLEADSFDDAVADLDKFVSGREDITILQRVRDERVKIDGKDAQVVRIEAEDRKPAGDGTKHKATVQLIVIDSPTPGGSDSSYPAVITLIDHDGKAPPQSVHDTILNGIKVGAPQPSASAS